MTNREMQKRIDEAIQTATKLVEQWPAWKQNILVHSLQPMASESRTPIIVQQDGNG